jgi:glyoxylase-like metal-dependent hydrolase (beta-lactamase superfamily II)
VASLPEAVTPDGSVLFCGYASESSFGASSYLIRRPEGNVLVDSPRFASPLVRRLEELGGVALMVLTHRDDVADQFSGDHLAFDPEAGALVAWRDVCWWDWDAQVRSLARLLDLRFEWLLPGHGHRHHAPAAEMRRALAALVSGLRSPRAARAGVRMAP